MNLARADGKQAPNRILVRDAGTQRSRNDDHLHVLEPAQLPSSKPTCMFHTSPAKRTKAKVITITVIRIKVITITVILITLFVFIRMQA